MARPICQDSACGAILNERSRQDRYYKHSVCEACFNKRAQFAEEHGFGEWFEANFNVEDKSREYWNKVGAFVL